METPTVVLVPIGRETLVRNGNVTLIFLPENRYVVLVKQKPEPSYKISLLRSANALGS